MIPKLELLKPQNSKKPFIQWCVCNTVDWTCLTFALLQKWVLAGESKIVNLIGVWVMDDPKIANVESQKPLTRLCL